MIYVSKELKRELAFELQGSRVFEKRKEACFSEREIFLKRRKNILHNENNPNNSRFAIRYFKQGFQ